MGLRDGAAPWPPSYPILAPAVFAFNPYSGLLLPAVLQGLVFAAVSLARWRREGRAYDAIAAAVLLVGALHVAQWMLGFAGWYDGRDWRTTAMFYVDWGHLAALGPLLYFYFRALTNADFHWRRRHGWHFLPAALFCAVPIAVLLYDLGIHVGFCGASLAYFDGTRGPGMQFAQTRLAWLDAVEDYFVYPHLAVYLALTARAYRRYRGYVATEFANAGEFALSGLRNLPITFTVGALAVAFSEVYAYWTGANSYVDAWWRFLAVGVVVFAAAIQFHALHPRRVRALRFPNADNAPPQGPPVREVGLSPKPPTRRPPPETSAPPRTDTPELIDRLETRLREHRDHLQPDLKLAELARRTNTTTATLSRAINAHYGTNFSDYVNGHRCEAFLSRLRAGDHERHTLLSLALDSGFNSKSTFNRAFRKRYGYPPGKAVEHLRDRPPHPGGTDRPAGATS